MIMTDVIRPVRCWPDWRVIRMILLHGCKDGRAILMAVSIILWWMMWIVRGGLRF